MTTMENIETPVTDREGKGRFSSQDNRQNIIQMRTLTTNRFLTKTLRALCCVGALTACSAWATVVSWQLNPNGVSGATKDSSRASDVTTARGFDNTGAVLYQSAAASEPFQFAANSNTPTRSATELDEAMGRTFDEEFVSVPTVQFSATGAVAATASKDVSMASMTSGPGPAPAPEMSALFPIVGLIAAVSCTQILRRRRAAQQSASRSVG
jgi:hypothetical protein